MVFHAVRLWRHECVKFQIGFKMKMKAQVLYLYVEAGHIGEDFRIKPLKCFALMMNSTKN